MVRSIRRLKERAWKQFSLFIRLRDALRTTGSLTHARCISCGVIKPIAEMDAGHFRAGRSGENLFNEKGVHAQCKYCNGPMSGNTYHYGVAIIKLYGEGIIDEINRMANTVKKWRASELDELEYEYKKRYKELIDGAL